MFFEEYDYDLDMQVKAEEAREAATQQKAIEDAMNCLREGDSLEKISRCIGLPLEQVLELQRGI